MVTQLIPSSPFNRLLNELGYPDRLVSYYDMQHRGHRVDHYLETGFADMFDENDKYVGRAIAEEILDGPVEEERNGN